MRTTRGGLNYEVVSPEQMIAGLTDDDYWSWRCGYPKCQVVTQGGKAGLLSHKKVVHNEE